MKKSKTTNIIVGLVFLAIGIILFGNNLKLWDINLFFKGWWTLFIIVPSVISLCRGSNKISSLVSILIGVLLLLASQDIIEWSLLWKLILPIIFVAIGLSFIFSRKNKIDDLDISSKKKDNDNEYIAVFSGRDIVFENKKFAGASCISVFGGIDLDLRDAKIKEDIVIDCVSVFGGIDIKTPKNVSIKTDGVPILGGVLDKTVGRGDKSPTIYINYVCVFGGVEIK